MTWGAAAVLRGVTAAYAGTLVVATHVPRIAIQSPSSSPVPADKVAHLLAYCVLGTLFGLAMWGSGWRRFWSFVMAIVCLAVFAGLDEWTQPFFGRTADFFDWVADIVGGTVGLLGSVGVAACLEPKRVADS